MKPVTTYSGHIYSFSVNFIISSSMHNYGSFIGFALEFARKT